MACPAARCPSAADSASASVRALASSQLAGTPSSALRSSWDLDLYFERTYVISLPGRADRRQRIEAQLRQHKCGKLTFFPAVDGREVMRRDPLRWQGRMKTDEVDRLPSPEGAIGCLLSHYALLKSARDARLRSFLVLEDDVVLHPRAGKRFRMAMAQLPDDWEALYLGYNRYFNPTSDCAPDGNSSRLPGCRCSERNICRATGGLLHTHAIAYHARALDWLLPLLSRADESASTRLMPIDLEIRTFIEKNRHSARVYAVLPSPFVSQNRSSRSDIYRKRMYEVQ
ncbi:hypothetical protein AB1Y20_007862 [Prymnesium parvum]|uniref:Glycosyl transferase family 25 domain-containing protein n=1 Tax=Prymnesium parvum TaxID=97485 RepID=A0AB34ITY3_PRYPA